MCLARVTKRHSRPLKTERVAYKLIERRGPTFKTPYLYAEITPDVWMTASTTTIETLKDKNGVRHKYPSGFHVFVTRRGAETLFQDGGRRANMYVVKVRVRGIMSEGKDGTCGSDGLTSRFGNLVVQEMQVPSSELDKVWKTIAKAGGF
jgi:hypothetical protein